MTRFPESRPSLSNFFPSRWGIGAVSGSHTQMGEAAAVKCKYMCGINMRLPQHAKFE